MGALAPFAQTEEEEEEEEEEEALMDFEHSLRTQELLARLSAFQTHEIDPREEAHLRELPLRADPWLVPLLIEELKAKTKAEGLWNHAPCR